MLVVVSSVLLVAMLFNVHALLPDRRLGARDRRWLIVTAMASSSGLVTSALARQDLHPSLSALLVAAALAVLAVNLSALAPCTSARTAAA